MLNIDIVFVTYNSERWIERCFDSIFTSDYDLKRINIYVVDNNSADSTIKKLNKVKNRYSNAFGEFIIFESDKNNGFGKANNIGASMARSNYLCFFNIDTEVYKDTISNLIYEIENSESEVALWELRQFPYEHPKFYDILTGYTSWSSGAAFAVKRDAFIEINGFDESIFMYAEDVDFSWRLQYKNYKLKYCPKATINHYSYETSNVVKPNQYLNSISNNILLRWRFGSFQEIIKGYIMIFGLFLRRGPFENSRKMLIKKIMKDSIKLLKFLLWRFNNRNLSDNFKPNFLGWDYEIIREGAFHFNEFPKSSPLVSIIVRTCNRPLVLRETLMSIRNQTYKNIEVVLVEDGLNISEDMIKNEFKDLNIVYYSTGNNVGRSKAGNIAMEKASGEYLNFLDDDDLFFADHVEVLVNKIIESKNDAVYSLAYETPILIMNREPYEYKELLHNMTYKQSFNKLLLNHHNYIPIQSIMFKRTLFEKAGGLDVTLDALEDWDLWVKYSMYTDFDYIEKATSVYRVPANKEVNKERQQVLDEALHVVREKHKNYKVLLSSDQIAKEIDDILNIYYLKIFNSITEKFNKKIPFLKKIIMILRKIIKK